jgi:hypothetical protein
VEKVSLLDTAGKVAASWYAVYMNRENPRWWNRFLKDGFQHVQLWRRVQYGPAHTDAFWLVIDPCLEFLDAGVVFDHTPPWHSDKTLTVQRVVTLCSNKQVRDWFHIGPITCVELSKAGIGIRSFFVRTPWQLYKYIAARRGLIKKR